MWSRQFAEVQTSIGMERKGVLSEIVVVVGTGPFQKLLVYTTISRFYREWSNNHSLQTRNNLVIQRVTLFCWHTLGPLVPFGHHCSVPEYYY